MGRHRHDLGRIVRAGDDAVVQLERDFAASREVVWQMLTDPDKLALWLQAAVDLEPRVGGTITLRFANTGTTIWGRIVRFDAPAVLEYTWRLADEPPSIVRFELHRAEPGATTRLCLTHARCGDYPPSLFAAGWHHHLELFAAQLAGEPVAWDWSRYEEVRARYGALVA